MFFKAGTDSRRGTFHYIPQRLICDWTTFKDLDRSNLSNAYVSGMKEELNMQGNDYNVCSLILPCDNDIEVGLCLQKINTIFTCGYIVGMIPSEYLISQIPLRFSLC